MNAPDVAVLKTGFIAKAFATRKRHNGSASLVVLRRSLRAEMPKKNEIAFDSRQVTIL